MCTHVSLLRLPIQSLGLCLAFALSACGEPEAATAEREIPVEVGYVAMDPTSHSPVVVLAESGGSRLLPIWIGLPEARSIAAELNAERSLRPSAHDLAKRLIDGLDGRLDRVVVNDLSHGIYYAQLRVRSAGRLIAIDARPSDAIAIALRTRSPLFVRETVFTESKDATDLDLETGRGI